MKPFVIFLLRYLARRQIRRFRPTVIAVTGSVGKTSTKNAIAIALGSACSVRAAKKNYNNEFGVPLAIFGESSPGKDVWGWVKLCVRQWKISVWGTSFPKILVLEYGADKPGDVQTSCDIAQPHVAVVTAISPVHVSHYPSFGALIEEKSTLVRNVPSDGVVVLNADDVAVAQMRKGVQRAHVVTYGMSGHDAAMTDVYTKFGEGSSTFLTKATIIVEGETVNLALSNVLGTAVISACAAALLVAKRCNVSLDDAGHALNESLRAEPGRMCPLSGIKHTTILDDSYNAAPASVHAALDVLGSFQTLRGNARRIAVLGTMAELGAYSDEEHRGVGRRVAAVADIFVAVGPMMANAADVAMRAGMQSENVIRCDDAVHAGRWLDAHVHDGDIILVKGSQSARMEKAIRDILAEPLRAQELLCRQEEYWMTH